MWSGFIFFLAGGRESSIVDQFGGEGHSNYGPEDRPQLQCQTNIVTTTPGVLYNYKAL